MWRGPGCLPSPAGWTPLPIARHHAPMAHTTDNALRPGEVAIELPAATDAGVYFIGTIRTPWRTRAECPKRGSIDGPICEIIVNPRWRDALTGIASHKRIQVLYWMDHARRDPVLQTPNGRGRRPALSLCAHR